MHLIALIVLLAAALATFLDWWGNRPHRFDSHVLGLFLFIVGVILVFLLTGEPHVVIGD